MNYINAVKNNGCNIDSFSVKLQLRLIRNLSNIANLRN